MKIFSYVLMMVTLFVLLPGCNDKERGVNHPTNRKDLPRAAPTENNK